MTDEVVTVDPVAIEAAIALLQANGYVVSLAPAAA